MEHFFYCTFAINAGMKAYISERVLIFKCCSSHQTAVMFSKPNPLPSKQLWNGLTKKHGVCIFSLFCSLAISQLCDFDIMYTWFLCKCWDDRGVKAHGLHAFEPWFNSTHHMSSYASKRVTLEGLSLGALNNVIFSALNFNHQSNWLRVACMAPGTSLGPNWDIIIIPTFYNMF